jgi:hypothetical protein
MEIKNGNVYSINILGSWSTALVLGKEQEEYRIVYLGNKDYPYLCSHKNPLSVNVNNEVYYLLTGDENVIPSKYFVEMLETNDTEIINEYYKLKEEQLTPIK